MLDDAEQPGRMLVFRVGGQRFGIELDWVCGVMEAVQDATGKRGDVPFRDRAVPVVDARSLGWGGPAVPGGSCGPEAAELIVGRGGDLAALLVDAVEGLTALGEIRGWPRLMAPVVPAFFRGVAVRPEGELLVVDPGALLDFARGAAAGAG